MYDNWTQLSDISTYQHIVSSTKTHFLFFHLYNNDSLIKNVNAQKIDRNYLFFLLSELVENEIHFKINTNCLIQNIQKNLTKLFVSYHQNLLKHASDPFKSEFPI